MSKKGWSKGFTAVEAIIVVVVIAVIGLGGWLVWRHNHSQKKATNTNSSTAQKQTTQSPGQTADPYVGWKSYTDTGYAEASGISIKYPPDWLVNVGNNKVFAWTIERKVPQASFGARVSFLPVTTTAQQEWENCSSADACGSSPGSTKLEDSSSSINGLDAYSTKMRDSTGNAYYAAVIKSNKPSSQGTAFVEFLYYGDDAPTLDTYKRIVASATF